MTICPTCGCKLKYHRLLAEHRRDHDREAREKKARDELNAKRIELSAMAIRARQEADSRTTDLNRALAESDERGTLLRRLSAGLGIDGWVRAVDKALSLKDEIGKLQEADQARRSDYGDGTWYEVVEERDDARTTIAALEAALVDAVAAMAWATSEAPGRLPEWWAETRRRMEALTAGPATKIVALARGAGDPESIWPENRCAICGLTPYELIAKHGVPATLIARRLPTGSNGLVCQVCDLPKEKLREVPFTEGSAIRVQPHAGQLEAKIEALEDAARDLLEVTGEYDCDGGFVPLPHPSLSFTERDHIRPFIEKPWRVLRDAVAGQPRGWVDGVRDALRIVAHRREVAEAFSGPPATTHPAAFSTLDEIATFLEAMLERGSYTDRVAMDAGFTAEPADHSPKAIIRLPNGRIVESLEWTEDVKCGGYVHLQADSTSTEAVPTPHCKHGHSIRAIRVDGVGQALPCRCRFTAACANGAHDMCSGGRIIPWSAVEGGSRDPVMESTEELVGPCGCSCHGARQGSEKSAEPLDG